MQVAPAQNFVTAPALCAWTKYPARRLQKFHAAEMVA
jgi:hypothetical protein